MFKINTLISAYYFAQELKSVSKGQNIYDSFYKLKDSLSSDTWSIYLNSVSFHRDRHYYSFSLGYENIKFQSKESSTFFLKRVFKELESCNELHSFINLTKEFGEELEKQYITLLSKVPNKDDDLFDSYSLYRKWLDLFYYTHSTKIYNFLQTNKDYYSNKEIYNFLNDRDFTPFSSFNRKLIRKMKSYHNYAFALEFFEVIRLKTMELIFETHFDMQLELDLSNKEFYCREKQLNRFRIFELKANNNFNFITKSEGSFAIIFKDNNVVDVGQISKRRIKYKGINENSLSTLRISLYPRNDKELFIFDSN